jgi:hypothetical protein
MTSWFMVHSRRTRMVHDVMDVVLSEVVKGGVGVGGGGPSKSGFHRCPWLS